MIQKYYEKLEFDADFAFGNGNSPCRRSREIRDVALSCGWSDFCCNACTEYRLLRQWKLRGSAKKIQS